MTLIPWSVLSRLVRFTAHGSVLLLVSGTNLAMAADDNWQELVVSPPAHFSVERLVPLENLAGSSLRYGLDPNSLSVDADGVVRFVLVARSNTGALNVLFEGIRCQTAEMKTYARWDNQSAWNVNRDAAWRPLQFSGSTRHGIRLAKSGVCDANTTSGDAAHILRSLRTTAPLYP
jgi:hypothetical protein